VQSVGLFDSQMMRYQKWCKITSFAFMNVIYKEIKFKFNCPNNIFMVLYIRFIDALRFDYV
jgi:hypothetical protein